MFFLDLTILKIFKKNIKGTENALNGILKIFKKNIKGTENASNGICKEAKRFKWYF